MHEELQINLIWERTLIGNKFQFQSFFNEPGMVELLPNFCVFHINAPGSLDRFTQLKI